MTSPWRTIKTKKGIFWETFDRYDIDNAMKKFDPRGKGADFASDVENPQTMDSSKCIGEENNFLADVNEHIEKLNEHYLRSSGHMKQEVSDVVKDVDLEIGLEKLEKDFKRKVEKVYTVFKHEEEANQEKRKRLRKELINFRVKNELENREADYPESFIFHLSLVFAVIIIEAIVNSYFFGEASDLGLLGGWFMALITSIANVGVSMLAGLIFLRLANHINITKKIFGIVGFIAILPVLFYIHLTIAHYREILIRNPDAEIHSILGPLWENPFGLQDMESVLLIAISVIISVLGIWKGYTLDDKYPGYGKVYRKWRIKEDQMIESKKELKLQIADLYNEAVEKSYKINDGLREGKMKIENIKGDIYAFLGCYDNYYNQAVAGAKKLLDNYRGAVQDVYEDHTIFLYSDDLLWKNEGLIELNNGIREETEELVNSTLEQIKHDISHFKEKQDAFESGLKITQDKYSSDRKIEKIFLKTSDMES